MASSNKPAGEQTTIKPDPTAGTAGSSLTPALTIAYHPDWKRIGDRTVLDALGPGKPVLLSRMEPDFAPPRKKQGEPLGDEYLSRKPMRLSMKNDGAIVLKLDEASTTVICQGNRVAERIHFSPDQVRRGMVLVLANRVVLVLHCVDSQQNAVDSSDDLARPADFVGESDALMQLLREIQRVADLTLPVLIRGETGTGKELVAKAIHQLSPRHKRDLVSESMAKIPGSLAEKELFGSERSAYTGATTRHAGYFEQAAGGTLFLDELGEASIDLQAKLLRVLETKCVRAVGAEKDREVDTRVIFATDADLESRSAAGLFKVQLLMRLYHSQILVPPLRDRRDDIGRLLVYFLRDRLNAVSEIHRSLPPAPREKPWLAASVVARLVDHDWPGNVRQLQAVVDQLVVDNRGKERAELTSKVERVLNTWSRATPVEFGGSMQQVVSSTPLPVAAPLSASHAAEISSVSQTECTEQVQGRVSDQIQQSPSKGEWSAVSQHRPVKRRRPETVSKDVLLDALGNKGWDVAATAKELGVARSSIYMLMKRFDIHRPSR